jgi:hypothetical protein
VPKPNYNHARKQKELARKQRQQEKQKGRLDRTKADDETAPPAPAEGSVTVSTDPVSGSSS